MSASVGSPSNPSSASSLVEEQFQEQAELRSAAVRVDRRQGIIAGVKILGLESRNGRSYRPAALARGARLYEGARVNVDHPRGGTQAPRGYEERIGTVRNVRPSSDGLYGDFHFNPKHRLAEQLLWDAEHAPESVGFSHNVTARTSREAGRTVVEEITAVQSVDLVADPATTRGLFEAHGAKQWDNAQQAWVPWEGSRGLLAGAEQQPAEAQHLAEQIAIATAESRAALQLLAEQNRQLREELTHYRQTAEQANQRAGIDRQIAAAGLPAALDTAIFREQCYAAANEQALARLITARQQDARLIATSTRPRSIEQQPERFLEASPLAAAEFAAALR